MVRRLILAVMLAATATLTYMGPAEACSIVAPGPSDQELLEQADLVFVGVAVANHDPNTTATVVSSGDPVAWTFAVEQVVKGAAAGTHQVSTARSSASCGFPFQLGRRYVVFASAERGTYRTALFSGTREVTAPTTTMPVPPTTTTAAVPTAATTIPTSVLSDRGRLSATGVPTSWLLVGLALLVAGAVLGVRVRRAR